MKKNFANVSPVFFAAAVVLLISSFAFAGKLTPEQKRFNQLMSQPSSVPLPANVQGQQRTLMAIEIVYGGSNNLKPGDKANLLQTSASGLQTEFPTSDTNYLWDVDHWVNDSRSSFSFLGSTTNITGYTQQTWDADSNKWFNAFRYTSTYDGSNRITNSTGQSWEDGGWSNAGRQTYTYDVNGYPDMMTTEQWDGNQWNLSTCQDYTYSNGLLQQSVYEYRSGGSWIESSRATFTYDGNKNLINELQEGYDGISTWSKTSQTNNTYNGSNKMTESISQVWTGAAWFNSFRTTYSYDGAGREILSVDYSYLGSWTANEADTTKYDGAGRTVETVDWSILGNELDKHSFSYNGLGNIVQDLETVNVASTGWKNSERTAYGYGAATAVKEDNTVLPLSYALSQNYPNPFNPTTTIPYRLSKRSQVDISIFNVLGQEVKKLESGEQLAGYYHTTWNGTDANGRAVASGIYYYKIKTDDFTETRKMVLMK